MFPGDTLGDITLATSLPGVPIPANTWVDLYAATGIVAATQLSIQNVGGENVILVESAAEPVRSTTGFNTAIPGEFIVNDAANVGAWAWCPRDGRLQVEIS